MLVGNVITSVVSVGWELHEKSLAMYYTYNTRP